MIFILNATKAIDPIIPKVVGNLVDFPKDEIISEEKIVFQQDGWSSHYKIKPRLELFKSMNRQADTIFGMAAAFSRSGA